jgi:hypothetical protein
MKKVDELTTNRREMDRENISGHMPQALVSGNFFYLDTIYIYI